MTTATTYEADQIIKNHAWLSGLPGFFPIPLVDAIGITAIQLDMIKKLCSLYGKTYSEEKGKSIIIALVSSFSGRFPAYMVRSSFKAIPGIGWIIGGIAMSAFAYSSTYATGTVFREHFDQGGTLHNFDPESFKNFYKKQFEKGKQMWEKKAEEEKKGEE